MQMQRTSLWTKQGKEKAGLIQESSIDIYTPPCVKQRASEKFGTAQEALSGTL